MPVLTIASSKGGPGKSTVAMILCGYLAADGCKILALDADPKSVQPLILFKLSDRLAFQRPLLYHVVT